MVQINRCLKRALSVFLCCSFFLSSFIRTPFFSATSKVDSFPLTAHVILYSLYFQSYWKSMAIQPFLNISIVTWNSRHLKLIKPRAHLLLKQRYHETSGSFWIGSRSRACIPSCGFITGGGLSRKACILAEGEGVFRKDKILSVDGFGLLTS